ncbi:hypothetical protein [Actinokineospora sp. NPDC004072]
MARKASRGPRTAVLLAVVALPLLAAAASYALADDPAPQVPTEVRINEVGDAPAPAPGSITSTTCPLVVTPAPPLGGGGG